MEARDTLAEKLQRMGYTTAAFTPNPFTSRHFGFDQGFDHFQDFMDESNRSSLYNSIFQGFLDGSRVSSLARVFVNFWQREEVFKPWESYYDEIIEWVEGASEPYFLWVFLMDAHNPYMAAEEYRTQSRWKELHANVEFWRQSHETPYSDAVHERLVTAYDDSIRYSDAFVGQLREELADDSPVIAVHGDHGEAFDERGVYGHFYPDLYEENVHVPLVVSNAESPAVESVERPVSLLQLPAIVRAAAGVDGRMGDDEKRPSFADFGRDWVVATDYDGRTDRNLTAIRTQGLKYLRTDGGDGMTGELYDLTEDPTEQRNLVGTDHPAEDALERLASRRASHEREQLAIEDAVVDAAPMRAAPRES